MIVVFKKQDIFKMLLICLKIFHFFNYQNKMEEGYEYSANIINMMMYPTISNDSMSYIS